MSEVVTMIPDSTPMSNGRSRLWNCREYSNLELAVESASVAAIVATTVPCKTFSSKVTFLGDSPWNTGALSLVSCTVITTVAEDECLAGDWLSTTTSKGMVSFSKLSLSSLP